MFVYVIAQTPDYRKAIELSDRLVLGTVEAAQAGNEIAAAHLRGYNIAEPLEAGCYVDLFTPDAIGTRFPRYHWEADR